MSIGGEAADELLRKGPENVVMRDLAALLGLDPLRPQPVLPAPRLQWPPKPDHMKERALSSHSSDRGAVVVVEVAVYGDAARFGEGDRFFDLASLEIFFLESRLGHVYFRASEQIGLNAHIAQGLSAFSGPSEKSPRPIRCDTDDTLVATAASSAVTSISRVRRRSNSTNRGSGPPGSSPRRAASAYMRNCTVYASMS